jgi:predicted unusual protein kinase regulating ubiquinone biosynthesis (AarF/ABC1/UbiB family)
MVEEFRAAITAELDYLQEAENLRHMGEVLADYDEIVVPQPVADYTTSLVLTMDYVEGRNVSSLGPLAQLDFDGSALAKQLFRAYLDQILVHGFVHADPHPGNFLLQEGPDGPRLGIVDFGACAELSEHTRLGLCDLYAAGVAGDLQASAEALDALGFRTRSGDVQSLIAFASLFDADAGEENREAAWGRLVGAAREDPLMNLPEELIMVGRVLIVQTGMVGQVDPSWSMTDLVEKRLAEAR